MSEQRSMFKTPQGEAQYLAAYDATLRQWPVPVESFDVPTRFGSTHVNACGPQSAPPLVLLHGFCFSSTMWHPNVADLSRAYRIYALDTMGDSGRSVCTRPLVQLSDFVDWLSDVFDELQIERAHVAGMSYGGFLALNLARCAPQRVMKLILLAPAASFLPLVTQFYLRGMAASFFPIRPLILSMARWMSTLPVVDGEPAIEQFVMTMRHFRIGVTVTPRVYTDDELRQIKAPTLLLIGEREVIYDPQAALKRALALMPNIQGHIVPGASHALTWDRSEVVNARMLEFLGREAGAPEDSLVKLAASH
jgi:pimeloyl-ACP methyl ester carboxylesterase